EEQRELHAAVLGVVAAHQFLLGLRQVERQAVRLGEDADHEQQAGQRLEEDVPAVLGLVVDDLLQVQRPGDEQDAQDGQAQGDLVINELSTEAERAEEAVFTV